MSAIPSGKIDFYKELHVDQSCVLSCTLKKRQVLKKNALFLCGSYVNGTGFD